MEPIGLAVKAGTWIAHVSCILRYICGTSKTWVLIYLKIKTIVENRDFQSSSVLE